MKKYEKIWKNMKKYEKTWKKWKNEKNIINRVITLIRRDKYNNNAFTARYLYAMNVL